MGNLRIISLKPALVDVPEAGTRLQPIAGPECGLSTRQSRAQLYLPQHRTLTAHQHERRGSHHRRSLRRKFSGSTHTHDRSEQPPRAHSSPRASSAWRSLTCRSAGSTSSQPTSRLSTLLRALTSFLSSAMLRTRTRSSIWSLGLWASLDVSTTPSMPLDSPTSRGFQSSRLPT